MALQDSGINGIVIGLLSSFGSAVLIAFIFLVIYFFRYTSSGRIFLDRIGRPGEYDDEQAFAREEEEALETMDDMQRIEYLRAKSFIQANPPESVPTDISLLQYLAIQEKGVSAWEFEPELEIANCFVQGRTEIEFYDSECTVMSNLPVPKQNEVYYWEAKVFKPENTLVSIGMATKPYPLFRLPGFHKYSVAYQSNGFRRYNQPFNPTPYGPQIEEGDVIGVGYRPRTGTIFFTRNGRKLEDVVHGLKSQNFFPAIGANGPCRVQVNLGQAGFVYIEANVKKWGLAPSTGSLPPPPPYGSEAGSILLEAGTKDGYTTTGHPQGRGHSGHGLSNSVQLYLRQHQQGANASTSGALEPSHSRTRSGAYRMLQPTSPGPVRSPTEISLAHLMPTDEAGEPSSSGGGGTGHGSMPAGAPPHHPRQFLPPQAQHLMPMLGLGVNDPNQPPPPEYTSPEPSENGLDNSNSSGRNSSTSNGIQGRAPLIRLSRGRGMSAAPSPAAGGGHSRPRAATTGGSGEPGRESGNSTPSPPIPSYQDALQQGAGRDRSNRP